MGEVKCIEYGEMEVHIYSQAREIHCADEAKSCTPNSLEITPDDLVVSDNVHVIWNLK